MASVVTFEGRRAKLVIAAAALLFALGIMTLLASPAFAADPTLTVTKTGGGTVTSNPSGIDCGSDCSEAYPPNIEPGDCQFDPEIGQVICEEPVSVPQDVTLSATAASGWTFSGWGSPCSGTGSCTVTMDQDRTVNATFSDTQNPSVSLTSPTGPFVRGSTTISANASDNDLVSRVEFFVKGVKVGEDTTAPYSMSVNTATFVDGPAEFKATAHDGSGRTASAIHIPIIDNTPPTVNIISGPNNQTFGPNSTQTWNFSTSDNASGVSNTACKVERVGSLGSFGICSGGNSHSVTNLSEGSYTFSVRATDGAGNVTTQTRSFSIDATPPDTRINNGPPPITKETGATFTFSALGEAASRFECRVYPRGTTPGLFSTCSGSGTHTVNGLETRDYTFDVRAVDAVGNADATPASQTWTVDATPPVVNITDGPEQNSISRSNSPSFSFTATDTTTVSFFCKLDSAPDFTSCSSPQPYSNLADGPHTFRVKGRDAAGNESIEVVRFWTVDTTAPSLSVDGPPNGSAHKSDSVLTWTFSASDATSDVVPPLECKVGRVGSPAIYSPCETNSTHSVSNLTEGSYEFWVKATNGAGITAEEQRTFSIDATPPTSPVINNGPPQLANSRTASFSFSSEPDATFLCSIDSTADASFSACFSGDNFTVSSDGSHTFRVKAKDQVGNVNQNFASYTWTVDTKKPAVLRGFTPTGTGVSPKAKPTVKFSEKMDKASVEASKNGKPTTFFLKTGRTTVAATVKYVETATGQFKAIMTPASPLRSGVTYTATVSTAAKDLAGNALAKAKTWTFTVK